MTAKLRATGEAVDHPDDGIVGHGKAVIAAERDGLALLGESLGESFVAAVRALLDLHGRVIVSGLGKSGHIAGKIAATLASTGTPASFVHAAEAAHGDMGMISRHDAVLLLSNSGETAELLPIIRHVNRLKVPLIGVTSAAGSTLARNADIRLLFPPSPEACPVGVAPTTSTTMMLALGDALAMAVMQRRQFSRDDFQLLHPGGSIGLKLTRVCEFMHVGERMPLVAPDMPMPEVIMVMTSKSFGIAGVVDGAGRLVGVITDGDLRRHIADIATATAVEVMTSSPRVIGTSTLAEDALKFLNLNKVTALFIVDDETEFPDCGVPVGLVHVHDFLRLGFE